MLYFSQHVSPKIITEIPNRPKLFFLGHSEMGSKDNYAQGCPDLLLDGSLWPLSNFQFKATKFQGSFGS